MQQSMVRLNSIFIIGVVAGCSFLAAILSPQPVRADLPPRPTPTSIVLTPTATATPADPTPTTPTDPTPTVQATVQPTAAATATRIPVATLLLKVTKAQAGLGSVVQWQNAQGQWLDIEGWRGAVNHGKTIWWVEPKDWGKAHYRWVVYEAASGKIMATSQPFSLPKQRGEVLTVTLTPS